MLVPKGQISPGLSFFRALEGLTKPQSPAQTAQSKAAAKSESTQQLQKNASDAVQASRQADPNETAQRAKRAVEGGGNFPRGSFLDIRV